MPQLSLDSCVWFGEQSLLISAVFPVAPCVAGCDQLRADLGTNSDELLTLCRGERREVGYDKFDLVAEKVIEERVPGTSRRVFIDQDIELIWIIRTDKVLQRSFKIVVEMKPAKKRSRFRDFKGMAVDNIDNDRS